VSLRAIATLSHTVGFLGLVVAGVAQWIFFQEGNFSEVAGAVFIPFLGEHGIYTSKPLGIAWYTGVVLFILGFAATALCWSLEKRRRS
jgi:hypothetical protein